MTSFLLTILNWTPDGLTVAGVDRYRTLETCQAIGHLAFQWFGSDWACLGQVWA